MNAASVFFSGIGPYKDSARRRLASTEERGAGKRDTGFMWNVFLKFTARKDHDREPAELRALAGVSYDSTQV